MYGGQNWQILFDYRNEQVLYKSVQIDLDQHFPCCMTQVNTVPNVCRRHKRIHCTALESILPKYRKNNNNIKTCNTVTCSATLAWYCFSSYSFATFTVVACNEGATDLCCQRGYIILSIYMLMLFIVVVIAAGAVVVVVFLLLLLVSDGCRNR